MKQFVPLTDELIFDHPELLLGPCVPFSLDYDCYHQLNGSEHGKPSHKENTHE